MAANDNARPATRRLLLLLALALAIAAGNWFGIEAGRNAIQTIEADWMSQHVRGE